MEGRNVRVQAQTVVKLQKYKEETGVPIAVIIRKAVDEYLKQRDFDSVAKMENQGGGK